MSDTSEKNKLYFLGITKKPKMGGVEMSAFAVDWRGKSRRVTVALEDELIEFWGYNKMSIRIGDFGDMPTLSKLFEMLGTYYVEEFNLLNEEPHGSLFSKNDFCKSAGKCMGLQEVLAALKSKELHLHRKHEYQ